mmetsp:Transcript_33725/g.107790  ORF Transcript_33725/g.107790 Transcript_33725/m.107790 type:complete len:205 (-) Transcript_33725:42-656(-)
MLFVGTGPWASSSSTPSPRAPSPSPRPSPTSTPPPSSAAATPSPPSRRPTSQRRCPTSPPAAAPPSNSLKARNSPASPPSMTPRKDGWMGKRKEGSEGEEKIKKEMPPRSLLAGWRIVLWRAHASSSHLSTHLHTHSLTPTSSFSSPLLSKKKVPASFQIVSPATPIGLVTVTPSRSRRSSCHRSHFNGAQSRSAALLNRGVAT